MTVGKVTVTTATAAVPVVPAEEAVEMQAEIQAGGSYRAAVRVALQSKDQGGSVCQYAKNKCG